MHVRNNGPETHGFGAGTLDAKALGMNTPKTIITTLSALALVVSFTTGCNMETGEPIEETGQSAESLAGADTPETAASPAAKAGKEKRHGKFGRHGKRHGKSHAMRLMRTAEKSLDLSAEQKTAIEAIRADLKASAKTGRPERGAAGAKPDLDAIKTAVAARTAADVKAVNALHAALTSDQRAALVATVNDRMANRGDRAKGSDKADADGNRRSRRARRAQAGDKGQRHARRGGGKRGGGMRGGLFAKAGIELSDEQKAQFKALHEEGKANRPDRKAKFEEMKASRTKMLAAFATDTFDAADFIVAPNVEQRFAARTERMKKFQAILTEDQRAQIKSFMESRKGRRMNKHKVPSADVAEQAVGNPVAL